MSATRIFVDCHVFDDGFQGTTTYLKGLYRELIRQKDKQFFLAASNTEAIRAVFGTHSNVVYLKYRKKNKFFRLLFDTPALIRKHKIDFAHFQYIVSPVKRCKYIVTTHDVLFLDFPEYFPALNRIKNTYLYKWSDKFADIIFTVSPYSKNQIRRHFNIENVGITTNGVEEAFFESYDKAEVKKEVAARYHLSEYLIYVSRWEPRKKHDLVLKSFVRLKLYENHQLLFIGDNTFHNKIYDDYYETLDPSVKEKIITLRNIDFQTLLLLLRGAKASMYPSVAEGFGIPPLEALAARIPTVSSNATAMSDFDFLSDYLFDPYDQNDFEAKLLKSFNMTDEELDRIICSIRERYNWPAAAQIFTRTIEDHKKSPGRKRA